MAKHKKSVFRSTHQPRRGERMYRSQWDAQQHAGFDHDPPSGCFFPGLFVLCTVALAVIGAIL